MFDEANAYNKNKFAEFEARKIPYSEQLGLQTERDQKQLAAKYAAAVAARRDPTGDDLYYLGLLHWVAENLDGTFDALSKYLARDDKAAEGQTARSLITVIAAKQRKFDQALSVLADYLKNQPTKASERSRMESEIAKATSPNKRRLRAVPHASKVHTATPRLSCSDGGITQRGLDEVLDTGMVVHECYKTLGSVLKEADDALDDLRKTGAAIGSPVFITMRRTSL